MIILLLLLALGGSTGGFFLGRASFAQGWGITPLPTTYAGILEEKIDQQLAQSMSLKVSPPFTGYIDNNGLLLSSGTHLSINHYIYFPYEVLFRATYDGYVMSRWFIVDKALVFSETIATNSYDGTDDNTYTAYVPKEPTGYLIALYYCQKLDCTDARLIHVENFFVNLR